MPKKQATNEYGQQIIKWKVPEYDKHNRDKGWYIISSLVAFALLIYAFFSGNFLFAVIVIISGIVIILHDGQEPDIVNFALTDEGVIVGRKFYDYDEFKFFSIVYKPRQEVKNLYFEFFTSCLGLYTMEKNLNSS